VTHLPASISAGRALDAGQDGTRLLIEQIYAQGQKHQWGAELGRNGLDAVSRSTPRGDELIAFDFVDLRFQDDTGHEIGAAWKRRVWNTGPPMDPQSELLAYLASLTKGGGGANRFSKTNPGGHFGHGGRSSVLGHSNMFVATTQPGGGTHAIYIYDDGNKFSLANFDMVGGGIARRDDLADMSQDCSLDLSANRYLEMNESELIHPEVIAKGGVTVILAGPDIFEHYVDGDPSRGESSRQLLTDLTNWFNSPVPIEVQYLRTSPTRSVQKMDMNQTTHYVGAPTRLKSYDDWLARVPSSNQGRVRLPDGDDNLTVELEVYLLPEDWNWRGPLTPAEQAAVKKSVAKRAAAKKRAAKLIERDGQFFEVMTDKDAWFPWRGEGFIVVAYNYEMFPLYNTPTPDRHVQLSKNWGINEADVARRTAMIIRPPKWQGDGSAWGVKPPLGRASILGPNDSPLPVEEWCNAFYELLQHSPDLDFLRKALEVARPTVSRQLDPEDLRRIEQDMLGRLNLLNPMPVPVVTSRETGEHGTSGEQSTTGTGGRGGGGGGGKPRQPRQRRIAMVDPEGSENIETKPINLIPSFDFLTESDWQVHYDDGEIDFVPEMYCVVQRGVNTELFFNMAHPIYASQEAYYCDGTYFRQNGIYTKMRKIKKVDLVRAVQYSYATVGVSKVFYANHMAMAPNGNVELPEFRRIVAADRMTFALSGNADVDYQIRKRITDLLRS
jgi:hypothetical protein